MSTTARIDPVSAPKTIAARAPGTDNLEPDLRDDFNSHSDLKWIFRENKTHSNNNVGQPPDDTCSPIVGAQFLFPVLGKRGTSSRPPSRPEEESDDDGCAQQSLLLRFRFDRTTNNQM